MSEMLAAVVAGSKSNICDVQSTVAEKKSGLCHSLAVDVSVYGTGIFFCKKRLEIRFIDSCICGDIRNIDVFQIMLVNVAESLFQIGTALRVLAGTGAESKLCKHPAEEQKKKKFFIFYLAGASLQKGQQILQTVSEVSGIRTGAESPGGSYKAPETGKNRIFFQKKLQRNRAFFGCKGEFQIQDRAGKTIRNLKTVRNIRTDKNKLSGFQ